MWLLLRYQWDFRKERRYYCLQSDLKSCRERPDIVLRGKLSLSKIACWEQITQPSIVEDLGSLFGGIWALYFGFSKGENLETYSTKPSHMSDSLYTQYNQSIYYIYVTTLHLKFAFNRLSSASD